MDGDFLKTEFFGGVIWRRPFPARRTSSFHIEEAFPRQALDPIVGGWSEGGLFGERWSGDGFLGEGRAVAGRQGWEIAGRRVGVGDWLSLGLIRR